MPFTIDNALVVFDLATFESLAKEEKVTWSRSSLKGLRDLLSAKVAPGGPAIVAEIRKIPPDKRSKYKDALKYVLFSWPGVVPASQLNPVTEGRMLDRLGFQAMFASMDANTDCVDLQYGISGARGMQPYRLGAGRVRFADDFNNASNLGTGVAFNRDWKGFSAGSPTAGSITDAYRRGEKAGDDGRVRGIAPETRNEYVQGMLASRYSPVRSLNEGAKQLKKDSHLSVATLTQMHGKAKAKDQFLQHSRFVRSVRRACKGGIAMAASHPSYRGVDAKVHFVLDGLGDLGKMARKDKITGKDYVAITSSELAFTCRYWNDAQFPLSRVVKFYVNGDRVLPPWDADWTLNDAQGNNVYSNQEAWQRYLLCQDLIGTKKAFPKFEGTIVEQDDE